MILMYDAMVRCGFILFVLSGLAVGQTTPTIVSIANAALPNMDSNVPARLARSMATIFGTNLSNHWITSPSNFLLNLNQVDCVVTGTSPSNIGHDVNLIVLDHRAIGFVRRAIENCTTYVSYVIKIGNTDQNHVATDMDLTYAGNACGVDSGTLHFVRPH